jgi:uncharacterized membrane protein
MPRRKRRTRRLFPPRRPRVTEIFEQGKRQTSYFDRLADTLTRFFGTVWFLALNILLFFLWIAVNRDWVAGVRAFDPFPFNLLTTVVSLEALALAIVVLMSQKRSSRIADIREEVDFAVNVHAEREITKILNILDDIEHQFGVAHDDDQEFVTMKNQLDIQHLEKVARKRLRNS